MKIATRGSPLALWQARTVARAIAESGGPACDLVVIRTSGDEAADRPWSSVGPRTSDVGVPTHDKRLTTNGVSAKATFVKEIEDALLDGRVELAVHSSKDLSASLPVGVTIGAVLAREDARDAVVLPRGETVADLEALRSRLGDRPRLGTSSVRRAAQITTLLPAASFHSIRGNVETRLRTLDAGNCDALVLAAAGLKRLGLGDRISLALPLDVYVPAPGQGIISIEVRDDDLEATRVVSAITDRDAMDALLAERAIVKALGGGCQMPLGAHAMVDGDRLSVTAVVISPDGTRVVREDAHGPRSDAARLGKAVAEGLLRRGAGHILGSQT